MSFTAISTTNKTEPPSTQLTFCDQNYKGARVLVSSARHYITSLFYSTVAKICEVAGLLSQANVYKQLAGYQSILTRKSYIYRRYGNAIINFSVNSTGMAVTNEPGELKKRYGDRLDAMVKSATSETIPVQKEKLACYPIDQGICLGESVDFLSRYLRLIKNETAPLEAIKKVSACFTKRGTDEAVMLQIIYEAQNQKTLQEEQAIELAKATQAIQDKGLEAIAILRKREQEINSAPTAEEKKRMQEAAALELASIIQEAENSSLAKGSSLGYSFQLKRLQPLLASRSMEITLKATLQDDTTTPQSFQKTIEELAPGAYLLCSSPDNHAIAFVKETAETGYIFEPNVATLTAPTSQLQSSLLWHCTKTLYKRADGASTAIYRCDLI